MAATDPTPASEERLPAAPLEDDKPFGVLDYIVVNVVFIAFVGIIFLLMWRLFPSAAGLGFFYFILVGGFVGVSIYDFIFDRLYVPPAEGE